MKEKKESYVPFLVFFIILVIGMIVLVKYVFL